MAIFQLLSTVTWLLIGTGSCKDSGEKTALSMDGIKHVAPAGRTQGSSPHFFQTFLQVKTNTGTEDQHLSSTTFHSLTQ